MALKTTRAEIKRKFRAEIAELKDAIKLKCFECSGFQADGCQDCKINNCPLYPYRLSGSISHCSKNLRTKAEDSRVRIQDFDKG